MSGMVRLLRDFAVVVGVVAVLLWIGVSDSAIWLIALVAVAFLRGVQERPDIFYPTSDINESDA